MQPDVSNGDTTTTSAEAPTAPDTQTQEDLTANEHGLNFLGESEVSSRSRIHADAPPFYPSSSSHVTQQPQTTTYDPDFAPAETSGWDEPSKYNDVMNCWVFSDILDTLTLTFTGNR